MWLRIVMLASLLMVFGEDCCAQLPQPLANPEDLGLRIPRDRQAFEVQGRNVIVSSTELPEVGDGVSGSVAPGSGKPVVGKVYLEIGGMYVVTMPDGALRSVPKRTTTETDRPFEALDKDDLAAELKTQFKGFKTRATRHYISVYNTTDDFCKRKMAILETMYPMLLKYFRRQRLPVKDPDTRMVIVMFRTKKEFLRYRAMPESLLAYYNTVNNRVYMYQYSDVAKDAPLIAAMQSTSTIAHEGVHQILHNIGIQKRLSDWPIWISEGLAEYFAPTSTSRAKWSGVGKPNDLRMRELFAYLREQAGLGNGSIVRRIVAAEALNSTEYAISWALTHYFATKRKSELFAYLRDVSELAPLEIPNDPTEQFIKHFGHDFAKIEREMLKHVRELPYSDPVANQPYFLITATNGKRRMASITTSLDHKKAKRDMMKRVPPQEQAKYRFFIRPFPNRLQAYQAMKLFTR